MIRIFVDSASSIKEDEKDKFGVEIFPLRYLMGDTEYRDGIDMTIDEFYEKLIGEGLFPKTSLPDLEELSTRVTAYTDQGDDVIIVTMSSKISGTYSAISSYFQRNERVYVIDSLSCVDGEKLVIEEINRHINEPIPTILEKVYSLIPRIGIYAIPEKLDYLLKGGRLSKTEWMIGSLLNIKPVITIQEGKVHVHSKKPGLRLTMKHIASLVNQEIDPSYPVYPAYTYQDDNLKKLISYTSEEAQKTMVEFDNLDPVVACHWGPNAFGFIFIKKP